MEHICRRNSSTGFLGILTLYNNIYDITVQFVALQGADLPDNRGPLTNSKNKVFECK